MCSKVYLNIRPRLYCSHSISVAGNAPRNNSHVLVIVKSLFSGFSEFWTEEGLSHALVTNVLDEALFSLLILTHDRCSSLQPFP